MDNDLILFDRLEVIKETIKRYGEENFYISFSGGKDSTVLHHMVDLALPNNKIPRVFINTGIEYMDIVKFVKDLSEHDSRIVIINANKNIILTLNAKGWPFKSKEHSKKISLYKKGSECKWVKNYLDFENNSRYSCPKILRYQLNNDFNLKISDQCCSELKKKPAKKWAKENKKSIVMTGLKSEEGGQRANHTGCVVFDKSGKLKSFKPLNPLSNDFEEWFIEKYNIKLCRLYYPPFNYKRTGCKGCPFAIELQQELTKMALLLPAEREQAERIWAPVYAEYRRIGYRLDKNEQIPLFIME